MGLDPAGQRTVFERFVRGAAGEGPRHGLGLALAREVVDSHHGTISVSGEPGRGAWFVVRVPVAERAGGAADEPLFATPARRRRCTCAAFARLRSRARAGR